MFVISVGLRPTSRNSLQFPLPILTLTVNPVTHCNSVPFVENHNDNRAMNDVGYHVKEKSLGMKPQSYRANNNNIGDYKVYLLFYFVQIT